MSIDAGDVADFFSRYANLFNRAVIGEVDLSAIKTLYTDEFIAATPKGVHAGAINDAFEDAMLKGYDRYRAMGAKSMSVEGIDVHEVDDAHCVARVRWNSVFQKRGEDAIHILFDASYLLVQQGGRIKVFGWITGDEEGVLKENGVL
jgi:hypothetical protein